MSGLKTIFYQECPTCGRSLRIPVKYFGLAMACTHCGGEFVASQDGDAARAGEAHRPPPALESVDLIALTGIRARAS
jgi:hypothetical protein